MASASICAPGRAVVAESNPRCFWSLGLGFGVGGEVGQDGGGQPIGVLTAESSWRIVNSRDAFHVQAALAPSTMIRYCIAAE